VTYLDPLDRWLRNSIPAGLVVTTVIGGELVEAVVAI